MGCGVGLQLGQSHAAGELCEARSNMGRQQRPSGQQHTTALLQQNGLRPHLHVVVGVIVLLKGDGIELRARTRTAG